MSSTTIEEDKLTKKDFVTPNDAFGGVLVAEIIRS